MGVQPLPSICEFVKIKNHTFLHDGPMISHQPHITLCTQGVKCMGCRMGLRIGSLLSMGCRRASGAFLSLA